MKRIAALVLLATSIACSHEKGADPSDISQLPPPKQESSKLADAPPSPPPPPPPALRTEPSFAKGVEGGVAGGVAGGVVGGVVGTTMSPSAIPMSIAAENGGAFKRAARSPGAPYEYDSDHNTEEYGRIVENRFLDPTREPLSTFGVDVDRASYAMVRRFLDSGQLPPRDAVRIEELVNYFEYDYPAPRGGEPFSITTEVASCPWNDRHRLLRIGLQAEKIDLKDLPPNNLVFLLDVSGSMASPDKLPLLKSSLAMLVDNLRSDDSVAIVVYAGNAGLVLPPTPGTQKGRILDALERLESGGSTAGGAGIVLAYETARDHFLRRGNNRVILATDGDFNVGVSSDGELQRLIEKERASGIFLSVLGFGTGNVKDSKMELLADKGNGNYAYIDGLGEAKKVLVTEMGGTLVTVAKDVKLQVEFNPAHVAAYRLIGYENRMLAAEDFNDDKKDAGEIGAGHSVTALYEIVPPGVPVPSGSVDPLKYQATRSDATRKASGELATVKIRYKKPDGDRSMLLSETVSDSGLKIEVSSSDMRFAAAVAELGLLLRDSEYKGDASFAEITRLATRAAGRDTEGHRGDFIGLVGKAERIAGTKEIAMR
ncbi:MAG: VWA domain-containing protein [Acidobacteria bacterium]|nr:VWA domain-containing protein [Acidobacteriota bacterium]